jgi:type II secretory pathway predicted ATPase ExeA
MNIDIPGDIVVTANVKRALAAFDSLYYGLARFLLVCGATGSGKSTLARFLKDRYGVPIICLYTTMGVRDILSQIKHQGRGWSGQCEYSYRGSLQELFHEAASALADRRIPFFLVDEADRADAGRRFVVLKRATRPGR